MKATKSSAGDEKVSLLQAGHALAAAAEGVGLHHLAAFTVVLLPGAYVALDTETLHVLNPWRTLRVRPQVNAPCCCQTHHQKQSCRTGEACLQQYCITMCQ